MNICRNCGQPFAEGSRFCGACGKPLDTTNESSGNIPSVQPAQSDSITDDTSLNSNVYHNTSENGMASVDNQNNPKNGKAKKILIVAVPVLIIILVLIIIICSGGTKKKILSSSIYNRAFVIMQNNWSEYGNITSDYNSKTKTIEYVLNANTDFLSEIKKYSINSSDLEDMYDGINFMTESTQDAFSREGFDVNVSFSYYEDGDFVLCSVNGELEDSALDKYVGTGSSDNNYDYDYDDYNYDTYTTTKKYYYDTDDSYYSDNDYNNDGYLSGEEYQGAVDDYLDDYFAANPDLDPGYDY